MTDSVAKRRGRPPRQPTEPAPDTNLPSETYISEARAIERPAMRPTMREEDPRAAAARRAAEIRGHSEGVDEGADEFRTPTPPDGWEYEWKRRTLLGQEDPAYQVQLARMGWDPVSTNRHPEMMPMQGNHPVIERKGMVLMQRPAVISDESRANELRKARNQVRVKEQQLNATPDGTLTRDHPSARPQIKKGYSPIEVPGD
jgi:hypothetical protein